MNKKINIKTQIIYYFIKKKIEISFKMYNL